jgi:hypothetical protein
VNKWWGFESCHDITEVRTAWGTPWETCQDSQCLGWD